MCKWLMSLVALVTIVPCLVSGCIDDGSNTDSSASAGPALAAGFTPTHEIPNIHPMLSWANLSLGMGGVDISQAYNAPDGRGDGFTRVLQQFGSSINHVVAFAQDDSGVKRTLTLAVYRDELFLVADRREGLDAEGADAWFSEVAALYEDEPLENISGSQWVWGAPEEIMATFTRDNASDRYMTCTFVLEHIPTRDAWHGYNEEWQERHPGD